MAVSRLMIISLASIILLVACSSIDRSTPVARTPVPTAIPAPTSTPIPKDTDWQTIQTAIEYREMDVSINGRSDRVRIARVDPAQVRLRVLYDPNQPRRVSEWLDSTRSLLVVNGNYFDPQNRALGLIVHDGLKAGSVYQGFGGMFAVSGSAAQVRWNAAQPYVEGEGLSYAMQNFPMLVIPGGAPNLEIDDNRNTAPRTAVAQDRSGRILFVVSPGVMFTLTEFGKWLAASDLQIDAALNLDGGTSSGLLIRKGDHTEGVDSWISVPSVIVVSEIER